MATPTRADDVYDGLRTFAEVKAMLETVSTHKALVALVEAVEKRYWADPQQITITDAEQGQWTLLVKRKVTQLEQD